MPPINNVSKIEYDINQQKLRVWSDNNTNLEEYSTNVAPDGHGRTFSIKRSTTGKWDLTIDPNLVNTKPYTEITTSISRKGKFSKIDFDPFNTKDLPMLSFIGIDDIRDGVVANTISFSFSKSVIGIKTDNNNNLILRKEHYT